MINAFFWATKMLFLPQNTLWNHPPRNIRHTKRAHWKTTIWKAWKKLTKARSKLAYLQTIGTLGANTPSARVFRNRLQGNKLERNGRKPDKKVFSTAYHQGLIATGLSFWRRTIKAKTTPHQYLIATPTHTNGNLGTRKRRPQRDFDTTRWLFLL